MNQSITPLPNPPPAGEWSWPAMLLLGLVVLLFLVLAFTASRRRSKMTTPLDVLEEPKLPRRHNMPPPMYPPV